MNLSRHAQVRMQQRGIPVPIVEWLLAYGAVNYQKGTELYYFNKQSRKLLERDFGKHELARYEKALDAYVISSSGKIITVGHRFQRVVRH